jgi:ubiquitin-protein ligase E3 A
VLLDFPLPLALYKKVARQPLTLRDLEGFDPTLGRSLRQLLDYSGAADSTAQPFSMWLSLLLF